MATLSPYNIKYLIVHCTATARGKDFTAADVDRWHRQQGWDMIGYHYLVRLDGTIEKGRPETMQGAHCKGYNYQSLGICYVGGLDAQGRRPEDTRTTAQVAALGALLKRLRRKYPKARIVGHHNLNPGKACPSFDARAEYADL